MSSQIVCPTCGMSASASDHRQLQPVPVTSVDIDLRRCRNCGDAFAVVDRCLDDLHLFATNTFHR